jgi:type 1 fimbria pilin
MTSIVHIPVDDLTYVDVSAGDVNCTIVLAKGQRMRVQFGTTQPVNDSPDYVSLSGPAGTYGIQTRGLSAEGLAAGEEVWVRTDSGADTVTVVRGKITLS